MDLRALSFSSKNTKMDSERYGLNILDLSHQNRYERRQQRRTHLHSGDFNHSSDGWPWTDERVQNHPRKTETATRAQNQRFHEHADNPILEDLRTSFRDHLKLAPGLGKRHEESYRCNRHKYLRANTHNKGTGNLSLLWKTITTKHQRLRRHGLVVDSKSLLLSVVWSRFFERK